MIKRRNLRVNRVLLSVSILVVSIFGLNIGQVVAQSMPVFSVNLDVVISAAQWNMSGSFLAVAGGENVYIFDANLQLTTQFEAHNEQVSTLTWSSDGNYLATGGSTESTIKIWLFNSTSQTFNLSHTISTAYDDIVALSWSPDDSKLVEIGAMRQFSVEDNLQNRINVRDTTNWELDFEQNLYSYNANTRVFWHENSTQFAVVDRIDSQGNINIIDATTLEIVFSRSTNFHIESFAWKANKLAYGSVSDLYIINTTNWERMYAFPGFLVYGVEWNPLADKLALANSDSITIFDISTGATLVTFPNQTAPQRILAWHPSNDTLVSAAQNGQLKLWNVDNLVDPAGTPTVTLIQSPTLFLTSTPTTAVNTPTPQPVEKIAFAQDNGLYTIGLDGSNKTSIVTSTNVRKPAWSPDGTRIAYTQKVSNIDQIFVKNVQTGTVTQVTDGPAPNYDPSWSTSGNRIVFTSRRVPEWETGPGDEELYITRADGSTVNEPEQFVFHPADDSQPDWSSDNKIAFVSTRSGDPEIYWAYANIGYSTKVEGSLAASSPRWSPDGQRLAFIGGLIERKLYVTDVTTSQLTSLNMGDLQVKEFDWAPYSNQIIFTAYKGFYKELFVIDVASSGIRQLTNNSDTESDPAWAPSVNTVVLPTHTPQAPTSTPVALNKIGFTQKVADLDQLYSIGLDGSNETNISSASYAAEQEPAWSPDGTKLAFVSAQTGFQHIYIRDLATSQEYALTNGSHSNISPAWSPDGKWIVFASDRDHVLSSQVTSELYAVRSDGSTGAQAIRLTSNDVDDFDPDWSTDNRIVFVSNRNGISNGVYWTRIVAPIQTQQIFEEQACLKPRWSPDAQQVACVGQGIVHILDLVSSQTSQVNLGFLKDFFSMDWSPDGTQLVISTSSELMIYDLGEQRFIELMSNSSNSKRDTHWSPGQASVALPPLLPPTPTATPLYVSKIAYRKEIDGYDDIFSMNLDGSNEINLSNTSDSNESSPVWSPDGTRIAYSARRNNRNHIFVKDLSTGIETQLTFGNNNEISLAWSPDSQYIAYTSQQSGQSDIYIVHTVSNSAQDIKQVTDTASISETVVDWSINNRLLLLKDQHISWIDVLTRETQNTLVSQNCLSPRWDVSGQTFACIEDSMFINRYDNSGNLVAVYEPELEGGVIDFDWSPDGSQFLLGSFEQAIVYSLNTQQVSTVAVYGLSEYRFDLNWGPGQNNILQPTLTPSPTFTDSPTETTTLTPSPTVTPSPTPTSTATPTDTPTATATSTSTVTNTPTVTSTPGASDLIFADGFESGNLLAWSSSVTDSGDLGVTSGAALFGDYGLQIVIDDNNAIYITDETPNAATRYRVRFYFNPNSITMTNGDLHYIFFGYKNTTDPVVRLAFRRSNNVYQIGAEAAANNGTSWTNAGWTTITDAPHALELDWQAATSGNSNGQLTLWIDGIQQANVTGIANDTRAIDRGRIGAITGIDTGTRGTYYIDAFESRATTYIGLIDTATPTATSTPAGTFTPTATPTPSETPSVLDLIFADGFESGNLSAWSSSVADWGDLSVTSGASLHGSYGLQAVINDNNAMYVTDETPDAATRYRARFYFDPNSITMDNGDLHYIFYGYAGITTGVVRLEFRYSAGAYQIRAAAINNGSTWTNTGWFSISDAPHAFEIDWQASTSGNSNGQLTLWIDGTQQANLTGLANDTRVIDRGRIGAITGIDSGTRGTYYFDSFESRTTNYIGLVSP